MAFRESAPLWIGPPLTHSNAPSPLELEQMLAIATKFDVAARDERNRALGKAGEERVLAHERSSLADAGRHDLARRIRWVSHEDGDGAGFDIASFEPDGRGRLVEVKTTNGWERTAFHITRNELAVADFRRAEMVPCPSVEFRARTEDIRNSSAAEFGCIADPNRLPRGFRIVSQRGP